MSISDQPVTSGFLRELAAAAIAGACLALIANPIDPALTNLAIHPVWCIALVLAARNGARGLLSIPVLAISLLGAEWLSGGSGAATLARTGRIGDLVALVAAVAVAVVGAAHVRRKMQLAQRLATAELRATDAVAGMAELAEAALELRARCDRSATSLAFLTDIAIRMNERDPCGTGLAALDLALARTGAAAGFVQLFDASGRLRTLSSRGRWNAARPTPPAVFRDLTAVAAIERATTVAAHEVPGVQADDSDLVAPLITADGQLLGVIALRRVPLTALCSAVRQDLAQVARWATGSLARAPREVATAMHVAHGTDHARS